MITTNFPRRLLHYVQFSKRTGKVLPGSPPQIVIKLRPYSKDMGYEDVDVSAVLVVRCLPGYPFKCPKLQITPEKGLSESDANNLLSLLQDQAKLNAREGRGKTMKVRKSILLLMSIQQKIMSMKASLQSLCLLPPCLITKHLNSRKDLVMVHMLRLVCASKGTLADSLPQLATELYNLGIFSDLARDMASKPPSLLTKPLIVPSRNTWHHREYLNFGNLLLILEDLTQSPIVLDI
ncbi:Ubiquitin-conjugating enzyme/RWD-like [Sesbania bispinosa]|nr:Ubiquitin-conjugating enzyme/RWD-like [Sesbania bispinosa]